MKILTIIFCALTLFALTANAKLVKSTTTGGAWEDGSSWVGGKTPEIGDSVVIDGNITSSLVTSCKYLTINKGAILNVNSNYLFAEQMVIDGKIAIAKDAKLYLQEEIKGAKSLINNGTIDNSGVIYFVKAEEMKNLESK